MRRPPRRLACAACGAANPPGARFCGQCGQRPVDRQPAARPASRPPRRRYTPKHLAEKILTSKAALEGERKQVTVLFADLKGSMELLADRDPEEARKLLDPVLERMMEAVHRYEGTVNQVMGDGIMALFGAPLAHEDHAVRACYAALQMQASVARYAETLRRTEAVGAHIRVGLNSGEVVVRSVGSDLRMDYSAVGQTTHLAARLEQMASPGSTFITAAHASSGRGLRGGATAGSRADQGTAGAGRRLRADRRRGGADAIPGGRHPGAEPLRGTGGGDRPAPASARAGGPGQGQIVAVIGEAGVGKSRLVHELTRSHRVHDWLVLESGSVSYGRASPWLPVIDLLKAYFRIGERDDHREMREKVTGKLLTLDRDLEPILSVLLSLLQVPVDDPTWTALDPLQRRQRTLDAVRHLLLREARAQPLLVVFEDLHWIDSESQALLDALVDSLPVARLLLLVNYRPEYQHGWGPKSYYTQLRLDALPEESAGELLRALLGDDPTLAPLRALLIGRTRGNPFFLEESVRTLVETRALTGERGAYRLTHPVETIQVPETVHAILAARIDRLPPADKQLLQSAAVVGTEVPLPLLQAVAETPDEDLRRGLAHLQAAEYLYETSLYPEVEYTFKHALTHEVAYASLLLERRRALHARILAAMESRHADRLAEHVERLAHHAVRAEAWDPAVGYLRQAGLKAAGRSAYRQAAAAFEEALVALGHLPETPITLEAAVDLRIDLHDVLVPIDELARTLDHLRAAAPQAERLGDLARMGWVSSGLVNTLALMAQYRRAFAEGVRTLDLADRLQDSGLRATTLVPTRGDPLRSRRLRARAGVSSRGRGAGRGRSATPSAPGHDLPPVVRAPTWLAQTESETGSFPEAIELAEEAVRVARSAESAVLAGRRPGGPGPRPPPPRGPRSSRLGARGRPRGQPDLEHHQPVPARRGARPRPHADRSAPGGPRPARGRGPPGLRARPAGPPGPPPRVARRGPPPRRPRRRGAITGHGGARFRRDARGARQPGVDPPPARGDRHAPDGIACRRGSRLLPAGARAGRPARDAPARRPLPPRPRHALPAHRRPGEGPGAPDHREGDVPRDGHGFWLERAETAMGPPDRESPEPPAVTR